MVNHIWSASQMMQTSVNQSRPWIACLCLKWPWTGSLNILVTTVCEIWWSQCCVGYRGDMGGWGGGGVYSMLALSMLQTRKLSLRNPLNRWENGQCRHLSVCLRVEKSHQIFLLLGCHFGSICLKNRSVSKEITTFVDRMNITKSSVISASVCVEVIPACICMPSWLFALE